MNPDPARNRCDLPEEVGVYTHKRSLVLILMLRLHPQEYNDAVDVSLSAAQMATYIAPVVQPVAAPKRYV